MSMATGKVTDNRINFKGFIAPEREKSGMGISGTE